MEDGKRRTGGSAVMVGASVAIGDQSVESSLRVEGCGDPMEQDPSATVSIPLDDLVLTVRFNKRAMLKALALVE